MSPRSDAIGFEKIVMPSGNSERAAASGSGGIVLSQRY